MEIIHHGLDGTSYRLVYSSEHPLKFFWSGHGRRGHSRLCKHWPRITKLRLYADETFIGETQAKQDSRDPDNKDYGMWVCTKKMLDGLLIPKADKAKIWKEFLNLQPS